MGVFRGVMWAVIFTVAAVASCVLAALVLSAVGWI